MGGTDQWVDRIRSTARPARHSRHASSPTLRGVSPPRMGRNTALGPTRRRRSSKLGTSRSRQTARGCERATALSPKDVYAAVACLLAMNGIIDETHELSDSTLPDVRMPNRDPFVPASETDLRTEPSRAVDGERRRRSDRSGQATTTVSEDSGEQGGSREDPPRESALVGCLGRACRGRGSDLDPGRPRDFRGTVCDLRRRSEIASRP